MKFEDPKLKVPDNSKINPLLDDLTYNTSEHCCNCPYFPSPILGEITCTSQISLSVIYVNPSNKVHV